MVSSALRILDLLQIFGWIIILILANWAIIWLIKRILRGVIKLPVRQGLTFALLISSGIIIFSAVMAAVGGLLGAIFGNPDQLISMLGALVGAGTGATVGWKFQQRSTL
jgi:hypothetical protein